jgi:hypothetical protein
MHKAIHHIMNVIFLLYNTIKNVVNLSISHPVESTKNILNRLINNIRLNVTKITPYILLYHYMNHC